MGYFLTYVSVVIVYFLLSGVLLWPVIYDEVIDCPPLECYWICHCWFFLLINCVKYLKCVNAYQLVISINKKSYLILSTILCSSFMKIGNSCSLNRIPYNLDLTLANLILPNKFIKIETGLIRRCIINDNNMIIIIILIEYTL